MAADDAGFIDAGLPFFGIYLRINDAIVDTDPTPRILAVAAYLELLCRKCYRKLWARRYGLDRQECLKLL
jgi:hypothetical protein